MEKCPVCKSKDHTSIMNLCSNMKILGPDFPETHTDIVFCNKCGISYLYSESTQEDYIRYYTDISRPVQYKEMFGKENSDHYFSDILKKIVPLINKDSEILDFGSGFSELGEYIKSNEYINITALDPKEECIEFCKTKGLKTLKCSSTDIADHVSGKYDLIIMNHILEHICDLNKTLSDAKKVLNDKGYIYIENPDIKGYVRNKDKNPPYSFLTFEHVLHTSMEDLENLAACTGFIIEDCGEYFKEVSNYPSVWAILKPQNNIDSSRIKYSRNHLFIQEYISQCKKAMYKVLEPLIKSQTKLILWGIGASTAILLNDFSKCNVIQLIDNNPMRQDIRYTINQKDYVIQAPSEISDSDASIFIMSGPYKDSITKQIRKMGFSNTLLTF